MKKYNKLQEQLQMINNNKKDFNENMTIRDFLSLKVTNMKKTKIEKNLKKLDIVKRETLLNCNIKLKYWFNNQNISCRKYCKIETQELYKKDKMLYKLGYLDKKPIPPFLQNEKVKFLLKSKVLFQKKLESFFNIPRKTIDINRKLDKIAINTAKLAIKGYQTIEPHIRYFKNQLDSLDIIQYVKNVSTVAKYELASADTIAFRKSIRYIPNKSNVPKKIEHTSNKQTAQIEYTL